MRAIVLEQFKTPGSLRDVPLPEPASNEVRVRVNAAGVNPIDWKLRGGINPDLPLPRVLGQDFAGVVDAAGDGAERFPLGARVVGCARTHGAFAEFTTIRVDDGAEAVSLVPAGVDDAVAAALPTPGLTALGSVNAVHLTAGAPVVIVGAAGALGSIATQLAVLRGARVIAAVRPDDFATARGLGAERVVDSGSLVAELKAVADSYPDGIRAVIDCVSDGETLKTFAAFLAAGATIVTTIHVADEAWFRARGFTAINLVMNETPESSSAGLDELTSLIASGKLKIMLSAERPLTEASAVLDAGEKHQLHGKVVLLP